MRKNNFYFPLVPSLHKFDCFIFHVFKLRENSWEIRRKHKKNHTSYVLSSGSKETPENCLRLEVRFLFAFPREGSCGKNNDS